MFTELHFCGNQSSDDDLDNLPGWVVKIPFKYRRQLPAQKKGKEKKSGEKGVLKVEKSKRGEGGKNCMRTLILFSFEIFQPNSSSSTTSMSS
ncbi:hypothetical protein TNCT_698881 [Trichonephila clavata]|uniref:Uncharacterized protein n=1 Tax=Trichonephila clavata TaxID=2740835 RepID=A0A8X6J783_TRICU|nr:hypothetical protein TNCT_698881 [Trichonephila clavata]